MLPESPCSVNTFIEIEGVGRVQVTSRGFTAVDAAANLRDTIAATRQALAPQPPTIGALLEAACIKAIAQQDDGLAAKAVQAALLVLRGAVTPPNVVQGVWLVQGSAELPYVVDLHDVDAPGGRSCNCPDWTHRNGPDKEPHACKHICATMLAAKTQGITL